MSISSNGAIHYFTVMYLVFKSKFSLKFVYTKLIYNEQEEIFAYLFVGICIQFWGSMSQSFYVFTKAKNVPMRGQIQPV